MKNKKMILAAVAVVVAIGLMLALYLAVRPGGVWGEKQITIVVVHKDGTTKNFEITTWEKFLGPVLVSEGIVEENRGEYGLYFDTVDGEKADYSVDQGWWSIYIGEESSVYGADSIALAHGGVYRLVYTIG